jgi:site-specific DNA-cytosine methylase
MAKRISVIGLFSGAGGLEIGAAAAGADVRLSIDNDKMACKTLRLNAAHHTGEVHEADVSKLRGKALRKQAGLSRSDPLILVGGPPFSVTGIRGSLSWPTSTTAAAKGFSRQCRENISSPTTPAPPTSTSCPGIGAFLWSPTG